MKKKKYLVVIVCLIFFLFFNFFMSISYKVSFDKIFKDAAYILNRKLVTDKAPKLSEDMLNSKIDSLEKEIIELKKLLDINEVLSTYKMTNATIVNRTMQYFYDELILDKGYKDGIDINDVVINSDGVIGKVIKISNYSCTVKLITSSDIYDMVSVQIKTENGDVYGILSDYDDKTNSFKIEGIDEMMKIKENDLVVTTGLGEKYPSGLVIGKVVRVSKDNFDLTYILKVKPAVDFNNFHHVAVIDRTFD